jgi:hypothetical protein
LGFKNAEKGWAKIGGSGAGEAYYLVRRNPIQVAPNLGTVDFGGTFGGRELAEGSQAGEKHGEMGFVTVGWVVEIENLGFGGF